jgi:DNA-binding beta-propeller fold protein YncE
MSITADPQILPAPDQPAPPAPPVAEEDAERRRRRKRFLLFFLVLLLGLMTLLFIWYFFFRQPINPLPFIPTSQVPTYSTSLYGLERPLGVAASPSGDRIYVTQSGAKAAAVVMDGGGQQLATMTPPVEEGVDHQPTYVAIDPLTQEVYVTDRLAGTIYVYSRDGVYLREAVLAQPRPGWQPVGLAFDAAGTLYVTDYSGPFQKVLTIDRSMTVVRTLGEAEGLNFPNGIAVDKAGNIFVTDSNNGRLLMFGSDGKGVPVVGRGVASGKFGLPRGLVIDGSARMFAVDTTAQGVLVYRTPAGPTEALEFLGAFGVQGIGDGQFAFPSAVAIDTRGHVYVADTFNDRVQLWSY